MVNIPKQQSVLATDALAARVSSPESRPRMRGAAAKALAQLKTLRSCTAPARVSAHSNPVCCICAEFDRRNVAYQELAWTQAVGVQILGCIRSFFPARMRKHQYGHDQNVILQSKLQPWMGLRLAGIYQPGFGGGSPMHLTHMVPRCNLQHFHQRDTTLVVVDRFQEI